MGRPAVEHISATVARRIFGDTLMERKAVHGDLQRAFAVILGESSRPVLRVGRVNVAVGGLEPVGSAEHRHFLGRKLWQLSEPFEQCAEIGIGHHLLAQLKDVAQVLDGGRNAIDEVLLVLEIASKPIRPQDLQRAEEHKVAQPLGKMAHGGHLDILLERLIVCGDQLATQLEGVVGGGLPQKRGKIIVIRALASALEIDEIGIAFAVEHHVASLKIAIEKTLARL